MSKTGYIMLCLLLCASGIGCKGEPFSVLAPSRLEQGSALVSTQVPAYSRGLIQRVHLTVTSADTVRMRAINRDLNFPIPGGNLSVGQVADIPSGKRRFTVTAFDTGGILRFRGMADSTIFTSRAQLVEVTLNRIGGAVDFQAIIDIANVDTTLIDSAKLIALPATSMLDILEIVPQPFHSQLSLLPLLSVGLGDRFTVSGDGQFSRRVIVSQLPTGTRQFVAHLRDLSSSGTLAFSDTVRVDVDTLQVAKAVFDLKTVESAQDLFEIFNRATLPRDSTVIVVNPQF